MVAWVTDDASQRMSDGSVHPAHRAGFQWEEPACNLTAIDACPKCRRATTADQQHGTVRHADESGDGKIHDGGCDHCCSCVAPVVPVVALEVETAPAYEASLTDALDWALDCDAGDYLVEYSETGLTDTEDPGSRCGYGDDELDAIRRVLAERDLTLVADDRGLVAQAVRS